MPSSLIFAGLVATWLAVLVPMAARRRQQTPRPSDAALSGRVLQRPRRRNQEVTTMDDARTGRPRRGPRAAGPSDQPRRIRTQSLRDAAVRGEDGPADPGVDATEIDEPDVNRPGAGNGAAAGSEPGDSDAEGAVTGTAGSPGRLPSGSAEPDADDADAGHWPLAPGTAECEADGVDAGRGSPGSGAAQRDDDGDCDGEYVDTDGEHLDSGSGHSWNGAAEPERAESPGRARPVRYRPGRGGYDPQAAALAAQAKYAFRQRMVVVLALFAVISAVLAVTLRMIDAWYLHGAVDLSLVGYLVYLRRQVRLEQAIRARRAARAAGSRRGPLAEDHKFVDHRLDPHHRPTEVSSSDERPRTVADAVAAREAARDADAGTASGPAGPSQRTGSAEPIEAGTPPSAPGEQHDDTPQHPALPRLAPSPIPLPPPGATRLELDDEDPDLHDLNTPQPRGYRRAAGQ